ncbi:hypothetical protein SPLA10_PHROGS00128 [Salmonella phage SPLA10]|nr:hypothetical protein SPLA10_PHROGS00128 [Salmonella phage SPLA10]
MLVSMFFAIVSIVMAVGAMFYQRWIFTRIDAIKLPLETLGAKPLPIQWNIVCALSAMPLLATGLWDHSLRYGITALDIVAFPVSFAVNVLSLLVVWALWMRKAPVTDIVRRYNKLARIWFWITWVAVVLTIVIWLTEFNAY